MNITDPREIKDQHTEPLPQPEMQVPPEWEWQQQNIAAPPIYPDMFNFPKQIWIVIAIAFALGLFMGKSLQPIILKSI